MSPTPAALDRLRERTLPRMSLLYGEARAARVTEEIVSRVGAFEGSGGVIPEQPWDERDLILITYGNSIVAQGERPLATLYEFLEMYVGKALSGVHILPFFPYSSDDGFSVINHREVDPALGYWSDIRRFSARYGLMVDLVLNHVSRHSLWFEDYLAGVEPGRSLIREVGEDDDVSQVVRPRQHDLRVPVDTAHGPRQVWCTFSDDQVDLDYANPAVLVQMVDILLLYLRMGTRFVRLDAVAFLWKELGTRCIHLPQTHEAVKLMRDIMDTAVPGSALVTETNVPNAENLSYFGEGDEARMVYQFSLAPLLLHAMFRQDSHYLTQWADSLAQPPRGATFFNFTASHDGIGLRPVEGLVPPEEVAAMVRGVQRLGGYVSLKANADGTRSPYELNITYFDALRSTAAGRDEHHVARFLCSQTVMLCFKGVPGIYLHCLTATENDHLAVDLTGRTRSINRHRWDRTRLYEQLDDPNTASHKVFEEMRRLMRIRRVQPAFHPDGAQQVLKLGRQVFGVVRSSCDGSQQIAALANLSAQPVELATRDLPLSGDGPIADVIAHRSLAGDARTVPLAPYQCAWLTRQPVYPAQH